MLQDRLARHERLASVAALAAGAAHELGTPLATIAVASRDVELHATEVSRDAELARDARLIRAEVERCRAMLRQMSLRGAEQPGEAPARVEIAALLESVRSGLPASEAGRIRISCAGDSPAAVLPASAARQAHAALVRNALDAGGGQPVRLEASRASGWLEFSVADAGCGMNREDLEQVAEPFFTTKAPGRGMGLGTYLARVFAERLGGRMAFESEPGKGTRVVLQRPLPAGEPYDG
jgi:two-component system sensor histidine kinase RegB